MASVEAMAKALNEGYQTTDDAPTPTITPDTKSTVVVGNPNETAPKPLRPYRMVFNYSVEEVGEEDKDKMVFIPETNEYSLGVEYNNVRVKPIIRTKVVAVFLDIMAAIGMVTDDNMLEKEFSLHAAAALIDQTEKMAQLIQLVLGLEMNQVQHINPGCFADFMATLMHNEPNLTNEGRNFLSYSALQERKSAQAKK